MPALTPEQWDELRRAREGGVESDRELAARFGVHVRTILRRARLYNWLTRRGPMSASSFAAATIEVRRNLVRRLYRAIDTKLKLMEHRMQEQIRGLDGEAGKLPPMLDDEREIRSIGTLIRNLDKITEMASELDRTADGRQESADAAELFAEAERYRRELTERLAKFVAAAG
ncbi:MAG: hypothetical protein F9K29_00970 [Hyphomicrobiaceae bacterium]|nr:MAG: hypothetical protein F9K29_00970 [Hyphomicrobiaceae bacterium]